jgi:hypothetical protein
MNWAPRTIDKYMIATTAIHKMGDISRMNPDENCMENLCHIYHEEDENFIGMWVTGFGFADVKFPKTTTRELTGKEVEYFNGRKVQINSQPPMTLKVSG